MRFSGDGKSFYASLVATQSGSTRDETTGKKKPGRFTKRTELKSPVKAGCALDIGAESENFFECLCLIFSHAWLLAELSGLSPLSPRFSFARTIEYSVCLVVKRLQAGSRRAASNCFKERRRWLFSLSLSAAVDQLRLSPPRPIGKRSQANERTSERGRRLCVSRYGARRRKFRRLVIRRAAPKKKSVPRTSSSPSSIVFQ